MHVDRTSVRRWGVGLVTGGGIVMVVSMFGPWVRSGSNHRNSFELVDLIDRLGFTSNGPIEIALRCWPLAPLLVVMAVVLTIVLRGPVGAVVAIAVGAAAAVVGLAMRTIPESSLIGTGWGSALSALGGLTMAAGGGAVIISRRMSVAPEPSALEDVAQ